MVARDNVSGNFAAFSILKHIFYCFRVYRWGSSLVLLRVNMVSFFCGYKTEIRFAIERWTLIAQDRLRSTESHMNFLTLTLIFKSVEKPFQ